MDFAHQFWFVCPENILLDKYGHVKITDFGFAKEVENVTSTLCGTPDYLAPEIIQSKPYNKSVDWWSLGILIYEMLAGYTPFYDTTPMKTYEKILIGRVNYPDFFVHEVIDLLNRLITSDLSRRLGNLQNGAEDIKSHPWFQEVVWEKLVNKDIETPYEPPIQGGTGDSSLFDIYPDYSEETAGKYSELYEVFKAVDSIGSSSNIWKELGNKGYDYVLEKFSNEKFDEDFNEKVLNYLVNDILKSKTKRAEADVECQ